MSYTKLATAVATASLLFTLTSSVLAQDDTPSPSPSDSPSPEVSPSASPSESPSPEATSSTTTGGTTKKEVLGDTTTLGATGREKEIAKWVIAITLAIIVFIVGIKTASSSAKE